MGADFRALLEQADRQLTTGGRRLLLDADRRGQPRRAAADDHDVVLHRIAIGTHDGAQNRSSARPKTASAPPITSAA
ncbi:hypothetical protein SDC9_204477 [bioreactor metagenome]|uniref:Uncharacterized protein n=1 Tax=bioreactor metagenome TaxID=1076179 RepID=A0A645IZB8_9ZZZZ